MDQGIDTVEVMQNVVEMLHQFWGLTLLISYLLGFILVGMAIWKTATFGQRAAQGGKAMVATVFLSGIFLLNVIPLVDALSLTMLDQESPGELSYSEDLDESDPVDMTRKTVAYSIIFLGLCAVIYGGFVLRQAGQEPKVLGKALTHMIGGTLAINILYLINLIGVSLGGGVESAVGNIVGG